MSDSLDAEDTYNCVSESWGGGKMSFDTVDRAYQVTGCYSGVKPNNNNDPIFYLNTPGTIDSSQYRYLTYRIYSDGVYQDVINGMIIRWGLALGPGGNSCKAVGEDLPFDVGWNTYSIDLFDGIYGHLEDGSKTGSGCPSSEYWSGMGAVEIMRFDPNENQMGRTLHQELDWIKLTKMDTVQSGLPFNIMVVLNKPLFRYQMSLYYTDNLANPVQHAISEYITPASSPTLPDLLHQFLPIIKMDILSSSHSVYWDTTGITGTYYVCVLANDGYNVANYCSNAPVKVLP